MEVTGVADRIRVAEPSKDHSAEGAPALFGDLVVDLVVGGVRVEDRVEGPDVVREEGRAQVRGEARDVARGVPPGMHLPTQPECTRCIEGGA